MFKNIKIHKKYGYICMGITLLISGALFIAEQVFKVKYFNSTILLIWLMSGLTGVVGIIHDMLTGKAFEEMEKENEREAYREGKKKAFRILESLGYETITYDKDNEIWIANENLYKVDLIDLIYSCKNNLEIDDAKIIEEFDCFTIIPINQIIYFYKDGDVQYATQVSGGGGGGSSLTGALVGGLIAGETGAIIGSRRKNEEIKSTIVKAHDDRAVVVRYKENDSIKVLSYLDKDFKIYDYLLKKIPEKDLLTIQMNQTLISNNAVSAEENVSDDIGSKNQDISERLQKLQNLYDSKLITESEYTSKRQDILDSL